MNIQFTEFLRSFKTQYVHCPNYFGGSGALVHKLDGSGHIGLFSYVMTAQGVFNILSLDSRHDHSAVPVLDKTELCREIDSELGISHLAKGGSPVFADFVPHKGEFYAKVDTYRFASQSRQHGQEVSAGRLPESACS